MFALRGFAVSLSVFVIVYCALSFAVSMTWRNVREWAKHYPARRIADLLFALRLFPLAAALVITAAFTIPSFLLLEPRAVDEPLGTAPLVLGLCGMGVILAGLFNVIGAVRRASKTISTWTRQAEPIRAQAPLPVLRIPLAIPPMTAVGIVRPRILVSSAAESVLAEKELRTAMSHEMAHVRRRDNLRKLFLRFVAFPGMNGLESAWLEETEMAADDAAVTNASEALDLAAALIKLSRLPSEAPADLTAALVRSPASIMNARVERLLAWTDRRVASSDKLSVLCSVSAALGTIALAAITYSHLLVRIHTATEWFVR
jgi:Zn-dependent protease with chaperone function